jgi:predicted metal-dependent RNase
MLFTNLTRRIEIGANCYCLEIAGKRVVLDAGMHPRHEGDEALPDFRRMPDGAVDAIFLSHAHHDHLGALPLLMRHQPQAPVFMTEPTRVLSDVMLHNSVNVMTRQRAELNLANYPLFTHREVELAVRRWQSVPLGQRVSFDGERLAPGEQSLGFQFYDAGHVLGSAGVMIRGEGRTVFYSGDVNFADQEISQAASFPEEPLDVLIIETTRGDHETAEGYTREKEELRLARAIQEAFHRGGCVLMPLFALGKTQEMLAMFHRLRRRGLLANVPIYIGGLSTKLTEVYDRFARSVPRRVPELQILDAVAPFVVAGRQADPPVKPNRIYALSSGMMTEKTISNSFARRVVGDPKQSLLFVGYADPASPAGRIRSARRGDPVILDADHPAQDLLCHVDQFDFSGHASRESIRAYVNRVKPKKIILVHGDEPAVAWFHETLSRDLPDSQVISPTPGVKIEL